MADLSANAIIKNAMAGGLMAIINITVAISVAALMFADTKPEYFATGVSILLLGTIVCAIGGTLFCGFRGVIIAPRSGLAPVFAGLVFSIITIVPDPARELPTIVMAIMVASLAVGVVLFVLGYFKLGGLVRYIPYPVMGGFFAGIGLIFIKGGISVASGQSVSIENAAAFLEINHIYLILPALVFAAALYGMQRMTSHWFVFPGILLSAFALFYLTLGVVGVDLSDATSGGWLPDIATASAKLPTFDFSSLSAVDWVAIAAQAGSIATIALLSAIILLLDTSGIEIIANCELNPNRELKVAGLTNILNGVVGGYPGVHVASDTAFAYKLGGDTRLMGGVYIAAVALAMAVGTGFIGAVPNFILGGLLVYIGIDFLMDWAWRTAKEMPFLDYLIILIILGVITFAGILEGVAFGFFVAIVLFVISYSRLSVIKNEISGDVRSSHVDRNPNAREVLDREGGQIHIFRLQGFIFFGTADGLLETIRARVEEARPERDIRYLIIDFQNVSALDTSAVQAFCKLSKFCDSEGISLAISSATKETRDRLNNINFFSSSNAMSIRASFSYMDEGIAWAEDCILENEDAMTRNELSRYVANRLGSLMGDHDAAEKIAPFFKKISVQAEEYLFHQGEPGEALYLLDSGIAAVVLRLDNGKDRVVRIFEEGTILGEMALYTHEPRSASVRMEEQSVLYILGIEKFQKMQAHHPIEAGLFHSYIVRLLSERLSRANSELAAYQ